MKNKKLINEIKCNGYFDEDDDFLEDPIITEINNLTSDNERDRQTIAYYQMNPEELIKEIEENNKTIEDLIIEARQY